METTQATATTYEGWKNRATWNVALWIANDELLYRAAVEFMKIYKGHSSYFDFVQREGLDGLRTPDNFKWVSLDLSYSELNEMMREFAPEGTRA